MPAKVQVGRSDGWLLTTESGLQACYGKAPLRRGFSIARTDSGAAGRRAWTIPLRAPVLCCMADPLTLTAVLMPDENGWTMAQLAEWPAVVTCGRTLDEAREMLPDAAAR